MNAMQLGYELGTMVKRAAEGDYLDRLQDLSYTNQLYQAEHPLLTAMPFGTSLAKRQFRKSVPEGTSQVDAFAERVREFQDPAKADDVIAKIKRRNALVAGVALALYGTARGADGGGAAGALAGGVVGGAAGGGLGWLGGTLAGRNLRDQMRGINASPDRLAAVSESQGKRPYQQQLIPFGALIEAARTGRK